LWLGLRHYHVLQPTGLKIMIYADESPTAGDAVAVGCLLAQAAGGPVSLLAVVENDQQLETAQQRVESLARPFLEALPQLNWLVRQGRAIREISTEVDAGYYELIVVGSQEGGINSSGWQILNHTHRPVLMVPAGRPRIEQILICTAAGEPGKSDVRFGGRLARHTKAQATLFHVQSPQAWPYEVARSQKHLQMGLASLQALGVNSQIKTAVNQSFVEAIAAEAKAGDYDLVVIGAPAPHAPQQLIWSDMASQIVNGTNRPVVVVPMLE
jgi:nucleotide-binding universal stress UspA family protein